MTIRLTLSPTLPAVLLATALALLLLGIAPAEAKPKKIVSNGCTAEQILAPKAAQCLDQLEADIISGSATHHALYCSSSGATLCCEYDDTGATVPHSCTVLSRANPEIFSPTTHGSLSGGNDSTGGNPPSKGGGFDPGSNVNLGGAGMDAGGGSGVIY
jgi:hypothetical protein